MPKAKEHTLSFDRMRIIFFFAMIVALTIGAFYLFLPFFYPIFWSAIIAVMFYPMYKWVDKYLKHPGVSSFVMLVTVLVVLILPLALLSTLVVNQTFDLYQSVAARDLEADVSAVAEWIERTPFMPYVDQAKTEWPNHIAKVTQIGTNLIIKWASGITQNSARFFFMFFLFLYSLYYFFKDGKMILQKLMHLIPLGDKYEEMMFNRFTSVTRATMKSTFLIGGLQGVTAGVLFWAVGIQGALIWGVIMTILSIIPAIGSVIVWLPAGLVLLAIGNIWQGVTVLAVGAFIISMMDNLLKPPLIGKDVEMHPLLVLFSTLGGLILFGVSGFIIGPIIMSLHIAIMSIYDHYYKKQLSNN